MYGATSGFQFPAAPLGLTMRRFIDADSLTETLRAGRIISATPSLISRADAYTLCDRANFFVFHDAIKKHLALCIDAGMQRIDLFGRQPCISFQLIRQSFEKLHN